jgi:uncharacterized linocin/CFP29 family protein
MNTLQNVGKDEVLTTEQGRYINEQAVEAARRKFKGRLVFGSAIRKIDASTQAYGYDTLTHGGAAAFDWTYPGKISIDAPSKARTTVPIPNIHKEFQINKLDLASSRVGNGSPLNVTQADSAAYKVATLEDTLLLLGYTADGTNYDINGLYNAAGNSEGSSLDYGTSANIITSVNAAKALLHADNYEEPFNMVLHPDQFDQLSANIANTAITYKQWVENAIGGQIVFSAAMTAGTGLMVTANPAGAFEYVVAEDVTTETEQETVKEGSGLFGRVYVRGIPVVYDANAICKLTTI